MEKKIKTEEHNKQAEFERAAMPMIEYLAKNCHPHVVAIITPTNAQVLESQRTTGDVFKFLRD